MRHLTRIALVLTSLSVVAAAHAAFSFGYSGGREAYLYVGLSDGSSFETSTARAPLFDTYNQGWWGQNDYNSDSNDNIFAGDNYGSGIRNFFTFDISGLDLGKSSVTELIFVTNTYEVDGKGIYTIRDVHTDAKTLNYNEGLNEKIYEDLGTGKQYAALAFSYENSWQDVKIGLNKNAVDDLIFAKDAGQGYFSIGGTFDGGEPVPEPATFAALGVGALALLRRRKKA